MQDARWRCWSHEQVRLMSHGGTSGDAINYHDDFLYDGLTFGSTIYFPDGLHVRCIAGGGDRPVHSLRGPYEMTYLKHLGLLHSNNYWKVLQIYIRT